MLNAWIARAFSRIISLQTWMLLSTLIYSASMVLWFGIFGLSFMAFDAGFAIGRTLFVTAVGLYAAVAIGAIIMGWVTYRHEKKRLAALIMLVPAAYVLLIAIILQIGIWIQA